MKKILYLSLMVLMASACQSDWDDHYDRSGNAGGERLMTLIASDGSLSKFAQALRLTGTDTLLLGNQTYTVWAPTDQALAELDLTDLAAVRRLVSNHIARFSNPTSTTGRIQMLNGKTMQYSSTSTFNGVDIAEANIAAENGLLHKLSGQIPYKYNIRELMDADERFSDVSAFVAQFDQQVYDERHSTTYDSVFADYNPLLEDAKYGIGDIADEDSLFTMILPNNAAWQQEVGRVAPAFVTYNAAPQAADSIQQVQTGQAILGGLTFRGIIDEEADSLITVTGQVIKPVREYLAGYERIEGSNGVIYVASAQLNANDTCVWKHRLITEAEDMDSRVALSGSNCYIRNTDVSSLVQGLSEDSYLEVSSGNVDGGVTFYIADALATKYDVYVDFVNPIVDGSNLAEEKTKVVFQMMYRGANGRSTAKNMSTPIEISGMTADGEPRPGIISVKAFEGVELPVTDFYDGLWHLQPANASLDITPTTTLQVRTRVTATDARNGYVRKFRVDCVRFVPVTE
ncbi:MAG: fasciclin domain-containing protein [Bacteroidaceae bacterium]|nr:fasciclin domain-containing protein [Bacteroidaceae bacterium]